MPFKREAIAMAINFILVIALTFLSSSAGRLHAQPRVVVLKNAKTIIFELPSMASRQIALLPRGTRVKLLQRSGGWIQLAFGHKRCGWMQLEKASNARSAINKAGHDMDAFPPESKVIPAESKGGLSFHMGFLSGDFSYLFKFYYKNRPRWHLEGSFQYVADRVLSIYIMDANFKYLWRIRNSYMSYVHSGFGVLSDVLIRELHLGNINMILLGLFLWAIRQMETGRPHLSGWLIALGILIKPHFVILLPWLVMRGKWRVLGTSLAGVVAGLFIPAVVHGWQGNRALLEGWRQALGKHNVDLWDSPNTLFGMVNHAFLEPFGVQAGWWLPVAVILLAGSGYFLWMRHHGWKDVPLSRQYLEVMVLIGMIPLLTHTDTEHFLFSAPLLVLLAGVLFDRRLSIWLYATLFLIIGIPYYLNSPDFLGASGAAFMDNSGLLGLSCTIFLLASLFVVRFLPKRGC